MKKKILHIFPETVFTERFFDLIKRDKKHEHEFILTDINSNYNVDLSKYPLLKCQKISTFKIKNIIKFRKMISNSKCEKIIFHSGYLQYLILGVSKKMLKKSILVLWGGSDSSKFLVSNSNKKYSLLGFFYEKFRRKLYKNVSYIASIIPSDYENIKSIYKVKAKYLSCKYLLPNEPIFSEKQSKKTINIQVGHSGFDSGDQQEVLDILKKYKKEDINVFLPLSYGNESHIKKISEKGKKNFGKKTIPMLNILPFKEYSEFLAKTDVMIINCKIQQALGNLYLAFNMGKKVYLNPKGVLWKHFKSEGYIFSDIYDIMNLSFKEFIYISEEEKRINKQKSSAIFDDNITFKLWEKIFIINL